MTSVCIKCQNAASSSCGRCENASYCSRECQIADWPAHKLICDSSARDARLKLKYATDKITKYIYGNVLKSAVWYGRVTVEFGESVDNFNRESIHCAYINGFDSADKSITYNFSDRNHTIIASFSAELAAELQKKYPKPPSTVCVMFND